MNRVGAVSYTHLDVYKRQVYEEGRSVDVLGSSLDGGSYGLERSALFCSLGVFPVKLIYSAPHISHFAEFYFLVA